MIGDKHTDVTIEADMKTNSLIIHADAKTTELVKLLLNDLDEEME